MVAGVINQQVTDRWAIYNCDCMDVMRSLPDESIHGCIYSPPFAGLYQYSSSPRDHSNVRNLDEFKLKYQFVINETFRLLKPGRTVAVHAAPVPSGNSGKDALYDFPGDVIRMHQQAGFVWVSRHVIWKEPLSVRNRTMQKNLAHKTIIDDAVFAGVASADELLIFRKPGVNDEPVRHPTGLHEYAGSTLMPSDLQRFKGFDGDQKANKFSHWIWRRYASSIWDDIRIDRVLPFRDAKDEDDEKHVHPLQLDVIDRYLDMRTLPGEKVLTPYLGVGSEAYATVRKRRFAIGAELKPSYFEQATRNLAAVDTDERADGEFDFDSL